MAADAAHADDQQRLAAELVLALGRSPIMPRQNFLC